VNTPTHIPLHLLLPQNSLFLYPQILENFKSSLSSKIIHIDFETAMDKQMTTWEHYNSENVSFYWLNFLNLKFIFARGGGGLPVVQSSKDQTTGNCSVNIVRTLPHCSAIIGRTKIINLASGDRIVIICSVNFGRTYYFCSDSFNRTKQTLMIKYRLFDFFDAIQETISTHCSNTGIKLVVNYTMDFTTYEVVLSLHLIRFLTCR